jgi:hypothetical protein
MSSPQQNWRKGQSRFSLDWGVLGDEEGSRGQRGEMVQTIYAHMNK